MKNFSKLGEWFEVFRAGDYGDKGSYSVADLDKLVASYDPKKHEAPITLGHPQNNAPAYGWVEALKREGNVLFAKAKQVVPAFEKAVADGLFKKRSISLYREPDLTLRHIGFLGAMPPEVKGLADLAFQDGDKKHDEIEFDEENDNMAFDEKNFFDKLGKAFEDLISKMSGKKEEPTDVAKLKADLAESERLRKDAEKKAETADAKAKEFSEKSAAETKKAKVAEFVSKLKSAGKWIPAFDKMQVPALFNALLDADVEITFKEGDEEKKKNAADLFAEFFSGIKQIVVMEEIIPVDKQKRTGNLVQFNEPKKGEVLEVVGGDIAELAEKIEKDDKVDYGEALKRARLQIEAKGGNVSAGAV